MGHRIDRDNRKLPAFTFTLDVPITLPIKFSISATDREAEEFKYNVYEKHQTTIKNIANKQIFKMLNEKHNIRNPQQLVQNSAIKENMDIVKDIILNDLLEVKNISEEIGRVMIDAYTKK